MGSFSISLSGLTAEDQALSVISNDLANLNTTAFKAETPIFSDLFYQLLGSDGAGDPVQVGVGTSMSSVASPFTQGDISTTGVPTDVAIQGNGLFVLSQNGAQVYTRAGDFTVNSQGYLVDSNGNEVLGYPAVNGTISPTLGPLMIPSGKVYPPNATANMELDMNLDASSSPPTAASGTLTLTGNANNGETVTIGATTYTFVTQLATPPPDVPDQVVIGNTVAATLANLAGAIDGSTTGGQAPASTYSTGTDPNASATATATDTALNLAATTTGTAGNGVVTTTNMANGTFGSATLTGGEGAGGTFSTPLTVYDSLGTSHVLTFNFTQTSTGNWSYQITIPAADVGQTGNPVVVSSGTLQFDSSGNLISPPTNVTGITVTGLADGAKNLNMTWDLYSPLGSPNITQTSEASATSATEQDGYSAGTLQSYTIDSSGIIEGSLSNDQTVNLGQIAVATFSDSDGLVRLGQNDYQATLASGQASIGAPGTGSRGTLEGGALEQSNVDISTELTQLILAQSGYEANAKAVTTAEQVIQAAISLVTT